jgi:membrane protein required for colicin V production
MNSFDFAVIGIVLLSGFFAFYRGFVREALSIAVWISAAIVALYAIPYVQPLFERVLPKGIVAEVCAGGTVFILALMVLHLVSGALARRVKNSALSPIDRSLGLLFGLARGLLVACLGYLALAWFMPQGERQPKWFTDARSAPLLAAGADKILRFVPLPGHTRLFPAASYALPSGDKQAEKAMGAFRAPTQLPASTAAGAPAYSSEEQRDLNRLFQQFQQDAK